eukprot:TRINITY_DN30211_c0_g1_i1.p1 TRINITY_DN30211_c0_g1~~TRINITY_DN30211_c0_g1_i1.p1  ORF type:complete len:442 (-),score=49.85 TRINITY_DN30211_c0_g1_i1:196-1521(-)
MSTVLPRLQPVLSSERPKSPCGVSAVRGIHLFCALPLVVAVGTDDVCFAAPGSAVSLLQVFSLAGESNTQRDSGRLPAFAVDTDASERERTSNTLNSLDPFALDETSGHSDFNGIQPEGPSVLSVATKEALEGEVEYGLASSLPLRLELHLPHPLQNIQSDARGPVPAFLKTLASELCHALVIKPARVLVLDARGVSAKTLRQRVQVPLALTQGSQKGTVASNRRNVPLPAMVNSTVQVAVMHKKKSSAQTQLLKQFDCSADARSWRSSWSQIKVEYCCRTEHVSCEFFDCDAGLADWRRGWSRLKIDWCCKKEGKACETSSANPEAPAAEQQTIGVNMRKEPHSTRADAFNFRQFGPTTIVDFEVLPGSFWEMAQSDVPKSLGQKLEDPWSDLRQGPLGHLLSGAFVRVPPVNGLKSGACANSVNGVSIAFLLALVTIVA